jgi:hypothetical protein
MRPSIHIDVLLPSLTHTAEMFFEVSSSDEDAGAVGAFEEVLRDRVGVVLSQTSALLNGC